MQPGPSQIRGNGICLAIPGEVYVVYLARGGRLEVDLGAAKQSMTAQWFHPSQGGFREASRITPGGWQSFQAPDGNDWALLIR
jgi:hypothetical protein